MLRRSLVPSVLVASLALLAGPLHARDLDWPPVRQWIANALEVTCEALGGPAHPDYREIAERIARSHPNEADALAVSAVLIASEARADDANDAVAKARERLQAAEKLGEDRPLVRYARACVSLGAARHEKSARERRALLARADDALAAIASDATAAAQLHFYARAARMAVAAERRDAAEYRLRASEALVAARAARLSFETEFRLRAHAERELADLGAPRLVVRESLWFERTRPSLNQRPWAHRWSGDDETARALQRAWTMWGLLWSGQARAAVGRMPVGDEPWRERLEAIALLDAGEPRRALDIARRARNHEPGHAGDELVGRALVALGELERARPALEQALREPDDGEACARCTALLARVELLTGHEERGERLAARAVRLDDGVPEVLALRSLLALRIGDRAEANALGARAWSAAGRREARAIDRAEDAFKEALRFGRIEDAAEHAASFLAKRPASQRALRLLTRAADRLGDPREPLLAERLDGPQDAWSHLARGEARAAKGDLEAARLDLARALALYATPEHRNDTDEKLRARRALAGVEQALRTHNR